MASIGEKLSNNKDQEPVVKEDVTDTPKIKNHTIEINGDTYKIKLLPYKLEGLPLWEYMVERAGPAIGSFMDGMQGASMQEDSMIFTTTLMQLSSKLDGQFMLTVSDTVLKGCTINGKPLPEDQFDGNYGAWTKLVGFALKENYSSFFAEGWMQGLQKIKAMVPSQGLAE